MGFRDLLERFRRPEHTGSNRCTPCTILNAAIAMGLALAAAAVTIYTNGRVAAAAVGTVITLLSGATIYLRGYLVPGTPQLAKTYGPDWVLNRFGKQTAGVDDGADVDLALKGVATRAGTETERQQSEENRSSDDGSSMDNERDATSDETGEDASPR